MTKISQILKENEKEFEEKFTDEGFTELDAAYCEDAASRAEGCWKLKHIKSFLLSSQSNLIKGLIEEVGGMKFPEIKRYNSLGESSEFPTSKPAHESSEIFQQFFHNQALQKVIDYLKG